MKKARGMIAVLGTAVLMAGAVGCGGGSKESLQPSRCQLL